MYLPHTSCNGETTKSSLPCGRTTPHLRKDLAARETSVISSFSSSGGFQSPSQPHQLVQMSVCFVLQVRVDSDSVSRLCMMGETLAFTELGSRCVASPPLKSTATCFRLVSCPTCPCTPDELCLVLVSAVQMYKFVEQTSDGVTKTVGTKCEQSDGDVLETQASSSTLMKIQHI